MILFRADASANLGLGHIMRCLTLADRLASVGVESVFFCREIPAGLRDQVQRAGHRVVSLAQAQRPEDETAAINAFVKELGITPKALVCDHYERGAEWQALLAPVIERKVVIDDLADRAHACDLLIDPSLDRQAEAYRGLVPPNARILAGSRYAMLRPEFARLRRQQEVTAAAMAGRPRAKPSRLMISMGGSDPANATGFVLSALAGLEPKIRDSLHVDVVLGGGCPHIEALRLQASSIALKVELHIDTPDIAGLLARADLAFGASGGTSWERCCLGVATIMLVLAENQRFIAGRLSARGAALNLGVWPEVQPEAVREAFLSLHDDVEALAAMRSAARELCDGEGARRVAEAILDYRSASGDPITLRPMQDGDAGTLFRFQTAPGARVYHRNPEPPAWDEHRAWFKKRLADTTRPFFMIEIAGEPAGMVRLDQREGQPGEYEVSILVDPARQKQGLGQTALRLLRLYHPDLTVFANVSPKNTASQKIFENAGYTKISQDWYSLPAYQATSRA